MSKFWFRKNHQLDGPARLAETQAVVTRQESYDRAKEATIHLLTALKQWPGFDSTGNINGVIDHTLVNIDRLDDALDDLRDQIDRLRRQQAADLINRSDHPSVRGASLAGAVWDETITLRPKPSPDLFTGVGELKQRVDMTAFIAPKGDKQ
ncbi:hypothetical protein [Glutamicibacter mysorens]|uniref:hypothetical protein n=1 Tax=Glutamicibacter mysorens TaxID=257984 RepID=UPI0020C6EAA0|nr:hypothetical protein [Glutamicibacter mysorens]UTM47077.1 hypothetical protein XH9_16310 [Glutamicibacter mysorens]